MAKKQAAWEVSERDRKDPEAGTSGRSGLLSIKEMVVGSQQKSWGRRIGTAVLLLIAFLLPLTVPLLLLGAGVWVAKRLRVKQ